MQQHKKKKERGREERKEGRKKKRRGRKEGKEGRERKEGGRKERRKRRGKEGRGESHVFILIECSHKACSKIQSF